ncbi:transmembrane reductase CYB561D2-like [Cydia amplana]|uniref:transmembrane reductase CYB561D2-like n=1 Tax=Cydia amplana TaxID=1869771 RepID=UPI002FE6355B
MERLDGETEMPAQDNTNSEQSRLIDSNMPSRVSYMNLISNLSAVVLVAIIIYCCIAKGETVLFALHPIFMALGWTVFMASAVNAITPGDLATEWMPIRLRSARHWVLQVGAGILILIAFLCILSNKIVHDKPHFQTLHSKFGLTAFIFMLVTMSGGLGALYSLKLKHYLAPIYTKLLHASFGLLTIVLGSVAIILGIFSNWWTFGEILRYTNLTLILIVMLFTILRPCLKVYFRLMERIENGN